MNEPLKKVKCIDDRFNPYMLGHPESDLRVGQVYAVYGDDGSFYNLGKEIGWRRKNRFEEVPE